MISLTSADMVLFAAEARCFSSFNGKGGGEGFESFHGKTVGSRVTGFESLASTGDSYLTGRDGFVVGRGLELTFDDTVPLPRSVSTRRLEVDSWSGILPPGTAQSSSCNGACDSSIGSGISSLRRSGAGPRGIEMVSVGLFKGSLGSKALLNCVERMSKSTTYLLAEVHRFHSMRPP